MHPCVRPAAGVALCLAAACGPAPAPASPPAMSAAPAAAPAPASPLKLFKRYGNNDLRHGDSVRRAVFLGEDGPIASVAPDGVRVWDLAGHEIAFLPGAADDIAALPAAGMLAVARGTVVVAHRIEGGAAKEVWRHDLAAAVVPFGLESRGGSLLVAVRDRVLALDPASGHRLSRSAALPWLADALGVALAPDGKAIVVRRSGGTLRYSIEHPEEEPRPMGDIVWGFVVTPDSRALLGVSRSITNGVTSDIHAWDLASGRSRWVVPVGAMDPPAIGVSPDGSLVATASEAHGIAVRDARTGALLRKLGPGDPSWKIFDLNEPSIAAFTRFGTRLAWGARNDVRVWDLGTGLEVLPEIDRPVACRGLSADGARTVVGSLVWDIDRDAPVLDLRDEKSEERDFFMQSRFGPSPARLCGARPGELFFRNLADGTVRRPGTPDWPGGILGCAGGSAMLLEATGGRAEIWREDPPGRVAELDRSGRYSSADDSYFPDPAATRDRFALPLRESVEILDADSGASLFEVPVPGGSRAVALTPDDRRLAVARPDGVEVWDLASRKRLQALSSPSPTSVAFLAGGAWLAAGRTDGQLDLWDVAGASRLATMSAHHGRVTDLTAGGARLVSEGNDGTCVVWEVAVPP